MCACITPLNVVLPRRPVMFVVFPPLLRYVVIAIVVDAVVAVAVLDVALVGLVDLVNLCRLVRMNRDSVSLSNWLGKFLVVGRHAQWNRTDRMDLWCCFPNQANLLRGLLSPRDKDNNNETLCQPEINIVLFDVYTLID